MDFQIMQQKAGRGSIIVAKYLTAAYNITQAIFTAINGKGNIKMDLTDEMIRKADEAASAEELTETVKARVAELAALTEDEMKEVSGGGSIPLAKRCSDCGGIMSLRHYKTYVFYVCAFCGTEEYI